MQQSASRLFAGLFFFSGVAGLIYEVCWTRLLRLSMGNTVYSIATVLMAFMGGLALGAFLAGRWIERRHNPLRIYAILEAAIGLFCFFLAWILQAETPFFRWAYRHFADSFVVFHLAKLVATGVVVLIPATLMGATLPVLCRYFIDDAKRVGASVGLLYGVNALGAACGALLAGFLLVPNLGLRGTMRGGVFLSLAIAAIAWHASRRARSQQASTDAGAAVLAQQPGRARRATSHSPSFAEPLPSSRRRVVLLAYALSGLAAMTLQVAWARVLSLVLGSSTYAFSLLVAAFILGLFIGSAVASRVADRLSRPVLGFAILELGIGFTALAMVPLFERFPEWMLTLVPQLGQSFGRFQFVQFVLVALALLLPTACMGACLPVVARALVAGTTGPAGATRSVGNAYAWNALGTIAGALLGGFVLLPTFGTRGTIAAAAGVSCLAGVGLLVLALPRRRAAPIAAAAAVASVAAIALTPPLDPTLMTSGAYLYALAIQEARGGRSLRQYQRDQHTVLFQREGLVTTTTVRDGPEGERALVINGKVDASDGSDMTTQILLGHVPALLHPQPVDVAIVGLASGVTAGAIAQHPSVRSLDCIEIAPETVQACRLFDHVNDRVLDDPRLHIRIEDARSHLMLSDRQYDLIVSEPSNPWIAGIGSLFTEEFFTACRDRLRPGGIVCIWVQLYGSSLDILRGVARTFQSVFPETTLWESIFGADYLLVGSVSPIQVRWDDLASRLRQDRVAASLARSGITSPADLLAHHLGSGAELRAWIGPGAIYRDDHNRLEFDAPRLMHRPSSPQEMQAVRELGRPRFPDWLQMPASGDGAAGLTAALEARDTFWRGFVLRMQQQPEEALRVYTLALQGNAHIASTVPSTIEETAAVVHAGMLARGDTAAAERSARELLSLQPRLAGLRMELAGILSQRGLVAEAEAQVRVALEVRPRDPQARLELAALLDRSGRRQEAEAEIRRVLELRPGHAPALLSLGNYMVQRGELETGEQQYRAALESDPTFPVAWYLLASVLHMRGDHAAAVRAGERALELEPGVRATRELLANCYRELGESDKAARVAVQ